MLLIVGKNEKVKTNKFDVVKTENFNVADLAKGGAGRLTVYTEKAIKEIQEKFT